MPDPNGHPTPTAPYLAEGPRTALRRFTEADAAEFTARARESRAHHRPWLFPPERTGTYAAYADTLARDPAREGFLVCERSESGADGEGTRTGPSPGSSTSTTSSSAASAAAPSVTGPSPTRPGAA